MSRKSKSKGLNQNKNDNKPCEGGERQGCSRSSRDVSDGGTRAMSPDSLDTTVRSTNHDETQFTEGSKTHLLSDENAQVDFDLSNAGLHDERMVGERSECLVTPYNNQMGSSESIGYSDENDELRSESTTSIDVSTSCLFCKDSFPNALQMLVHCYQTHQFDIRTIYKHVDSGCCAQMVYAQFVNYVRSREATLEAVRLGGNPWSDPTYCKTVIENDGALLFDVTDDMTEYTEMAGLSGKEAPSTEAYLEAPQFNQSYGSAMDTANPDVLCSQNQRKMANAQFEDLVLELTQLKDQMRKLTADDLELKEDVGSEFKRQNDGSVDEHLAGYDSLHVHKEMLQDVHRTSTYIKALDSVFEHLSRHGLQDSCRWLLDVGCGTGILSFSAARAAETYKCHLVVYAVDRAKIIEQAKQAARLNGHPYDKIVFFNEEIEDVTLPVKEVDLIVSEWMGYGLFSELMLDSIIDARDRFLKADGIILPCQTTLYACLTSDSKRYKNSVEYWDDVYGFTMSNIKNQALREANIDIVDADSIVSSSEIVKVITLKTVTKEYLPFERNLKFRINKTCIVHGVALFFTADFQNFDHVKTVRLSTAPTSKATHWKQSTLLLADARMVTTGDTIDCTLSFNRLNKSTSGLLSVETTLFDVKQSFIL